VVDLGCRCSIELWPSLVGWSSWIFSIPSSIMIYYWHSIIISVSTTSSPSISSPRVGITSMWNHLIYYRRYYYSIIAIISLNKNIKTKSEVNKKLKIQISNLPIIISILS
jgi:hypothetical protein